MVPLLHTMGWSVCCLYARGDVVAYRLCYDCGTIVWRPLDASVGCGWSFYYFLFALSAHWHVGFLSTFGALHSVWLCSTVCWVDLTVRLVDACVSAGWCLACLPVGQCSCTLWHCCCVAGSLCCSFMPLCLVKCALVIPLCG